MKIIGSIFVGLFALCGVAISFAGVILVLGMIWAIPTMLLWDWLMPELFGLKEVTLLQAWGINVLAGILFKGNGNKTKTENKKTGKKEVILG